MPAIDIALIRHTLGILHRIGPAGLEETALMTEMEVAYGRPLTTAAARDTLIYCADRGWTGSRRDDFDRTIHWITDSGRTILAGM
jgi:hypothetical protein